MNTNMNNQENPNDYAAFIAIDWADRQHVFSLQVAGQSRKETGRLEQKPEVIGPWVAKLRERFGGRPVAVAVEQSRPVAGGGRARRSTRGGAERRAGRPP